MSKHRAKTVCIVLLAAFLILPVGNLVCRLCDTTVTFRYGFIIETLLAAGALAALILLKRRDPNAELELSGYLAFLPFLSFVNWALLVSNNEMRRRGPGPSDLCVILDFALLAALLLCFILCVYLRARYIKREKSRTLFTVLPLVLILILASFMFFACFLGNIGETRVVETVWSPDGRHYAELVDDDQGALGGNTIVNVYPRGKLDLGLIRFCRRARNVYWGNWGEFNDMTIEWKDNDTLLINGKEYPAG